MIENWKYWTFAGLIVIALPVYAALWEPWRFLVTFVLVFAYQLFFRRYTKKVIEIPRDAPERRNIKEPS